MQSGGSKTHFLRGTTMMATVMKSTSEQDLNGHLKATDAACCSASRFSRAILGGLAGTVAITLMMYLVAPMMLGHSMDIATMLGSMLGVNWWAGMVMHLVNGVLIFPLIFTFLLYKLLPGAPVVKGVTWGFALWLLAQVVVMPMMGAGFFSGGAMHAVGSLMGHIAYGALLGSIGGTHSHIACSVGRTKDA
jgi:hypothetical protein